MIESIQQTRICSRCEKVTEGSVCLCGGKTFISYKHMTFSQKINVWVQYQNKFLLQSEDEFLLVNWLFKHPPTSSVFFEKTSTVDVVFRVFVTGSNGRNI